MPTYEGLRLKILKYWRVGLQTLQLSPITVGAV